MEEAQALAVVERSLAASPATSPARRRTSPARAVLGYDTTGDGRPDAFDTNQDGRIDLRGGAAGVALHDRLEADHGAPLPPPPPPEKQPAKQQEKPVPVCPRVRATTEHLFCCTAAGGVSASCLDSLARLGGFP